MKILHTGFAALGAVFLSLSMPQAVQAQFRTPVIDGKISSDDEYGSAYRSTNADVPNLTWRVAWDDTNLYIAITDANITNGAVVYIDTDPQRIVNPGGGNDFRLKGYPYNKTNGNLPIEADIVIFADHNHREYRRFNKESGSWGTNTVFTRRPGAYASDGTPNEQQPEKFDPDQTREFTLPWSEINPSTGRRPENFNWFGYVSYEYDPFSKDDPETPEQEPDIPNTYAGGIFGVAPRDNERGDRFNGERYQDYNWTRYFTVVNSSAGSVGRAFGPNGLDSYTHTGALATSIQGLSVYDFTLNTRDAIITRTGEGDGSIWNIANNLTVANNSVLNFGTTTTPVIIGGNVVVAEAGVLRYAEAGGTLRIGRNIELATANSFLVNAGVTLTGEDAQTISTVNSTPIDFRLLTVQNAGVKTIATNLDIREALIINNGILATGANEVRLRGTARLTENATGYLLGRVSTSALITNTPGATSDFGNIGLRITQRGNDFPGNIDVLRITGGRGLLQSGTQNAPLQTIARRFFINNNPTNNSGTNVTLQFTYRDIPPTELNGNSEPLLRLYESNNIISDPVNGYQLVNPSSSSVPNPATNTLTYTGALRLNRYFSLADGITPLPVELISFTGKAENNAVRLNWATASELQNKGFEVERRTEAGGWKTLSFVAGNGTTNQRHNYNYLDRSAVAGNNYYRLRQIDMDGKSVYSQAITVQVGAVPFSLSPVPATDVLTINGLGAGKHVVEIYDARGQRVLNQEFADAAAHTLAISSLPVGVYMVRVLGPGQSTQNARFIKQ